MSAAPTADRRVVVFGEYPPFTTPGAAATLATVRSLLEAGREIEVVSPQPSAAHHHADPGNPRGAVRLARIASGAELVARLDPGILGDCGGRRGPAVARAATGLAVRRARSATIYLSPLTAPPAGKWVRAILGPAERVVVASPEDADRLRAAGLEGTKLSVAEDSWWLPPAPSDPAAHDGGDSMSRRDPWDVPVDASREAVEAEVRRRAARAREEEATSPLAASWPLQMLTPLAPAPTESSQPLFRLIKKYVHRLVAWEVVPIVEQVNHLHRATLESFGRQAEATQAGIDASSGAAGASATSAPPAKNR